MDQSPELLLVCSVLIFCPLISKVLPDSAHDAMAYYEYFRRTNITPFIDPNGKGGIKLPYKNDFTIGEDGVPVCKEGRRIITDFSGIATVMSISHTLFSIFYSIWDNIYFSRFCCQQSWHDQSRFREIILFEKIIANEQLNIYQFKQESPQRIVAMLILRRFSAIFFY